MADDTLPVLLMIIAFFLTFLMRIPGRDLDLSDASADSAGRPGSLSHLRHGA